MLKVRFFALAALIGLVLIGGCRGSLKTDSPQRFEMTGPVSVDVESFNGDVTVEVDPRATDIRFQVERESIHGMFRGGDAAAALKGIEYEAHMATGELGPVFKVRTWTTTPEPHLQLAHVHITLPALQDVKIKSSQGSVRVVNNTGSVDITTSKGDVLVMTNEAMTMPVTIVTSDGTIDYRVRGESTGRFDCETVRGDIKHRLHHGRFVMQPSSHNSLRMTLNDGENPVQLRTVDGDIRIAIVSNPTAIGTYILEP